jgi:hypothetical protein
MTPSNAAVPETPALWPRPAYQADLEPHFLFIITPPYSGSTALAKILNTGSGTMLLHRRGEGQWLVPGLCEGDRWSESKYVDYESVRAVWLARFQQRRQARQQLQVVIEKSPPNIVRIRPLVAQFRSFSLLANNRNPFANCASRLFRDRRCAGLSRDERLASLTPLVNSWLEVSRLMRELIVEMDIPLVTYEAFCSEPGILIDKLQLPASVTRDIDFGARIKVKDYAPATIVDKNPEQVNRLTPDEAEHIARELRRNAGDGLLAFFGYSADIPDYYLPR